VRFVAFSWRLRLAQSRSAQLLLSDQFFWSNVAVDGRGSIDDKSMLAANLAAFIALKRGGVHLTRDVIFLATADEEQFGDASLKILIAKYWDQIAAGYALNEASCIRSVAIPRTSKSLMR
jgi:arginine utilization protein RocB